MAKSLKRMNLGNNDFKYYNKMTVAMTETIRVRGRDRFDSRREVMTIPPIQKQLAVKQIEHYCATTPPEHVRNKIVHKYELLENTITLIESRPKWDDETIWIDIPVAKMRYDDKSMKWQLYCVLGKGKWIVYDGLSPQQDMKKCIDEIEADPVCIFWG